MTSVADMVGRTTADRWGRVARFSRGIAVVAALALAMIAALALSEEASAHGTGVYGSHNHGQLTCGSGGKIVVSLWAAAYNGYVYGHPNEFDEVYYRAHLYRWNGSSWVGATTDGYYWNTASTYGRYLNNPPLGFTVPRGQWRVTTEILWYDGPERTGNRYMGSSPNAWAQGTCTYY